MRMLQRWTPRGPRWLTAGDSRGNFATRRGGEAVRPRRVRGNHGGTFVFCSIAINLVTSIKVSKMSAEADTRSPKPEVEAVEDQDVSPKHLIDLADRAMALKQWDKAADDYAQALDGLKDDHEEDAPILAPILHRYGRSLLEHAIATSGALGGGGGQQEAPMPQRKPSNKAAGSGEGSSNAVAGSSKQGATTSKPADPRFSFSGDAEDDEEDEEDEGEAQGGEAGAQDDDDDLGVAFAVLDLARLVYQKLVRPEGSETDDPTAKLETINGQVWDSVKVKSELAEVLNDLGDVGLESGEFPASRGASY